MQVGEPGRALTVLKIRMGQAGDGGAAVESGVPDIKREIEARVQTEGAQERQEPWSGRTTDADAVDRLFRKSVGDDLTRSLVVESHLGPRLDADDVRNSSDLRSAVGFSQHP